MLVPLMGRSVEVARLTPAQPVRAVAPVVVLHEALGSVSLWRNFPQRLADATGAETIAYSRYGHGRSTSRAEPYGARYLEEEALAWLPALLDLLHVGRPVLFGHSDGATIALVAAAEWPNPPAGIVVLAPHVMVEEESLAGIRRTLDAHATTDFAARLARHHDDAAGVFRRWHETWLHPSRRGWSIEALLPRIACPVLAIQGEQDEYATMEQVDRIARAVEGTQVLKIAGCRHSPHRDRPEAVLQATAAFVRRLQG
jgi:pimeloyl-ACP methyl ester carboxylesterase